MDASFNTERAFVYALPAAAEQSFGHCGTSGFAETLSRGLVRIESLDQGVGPIAVVADNIMGVDVVRSAANAGFTTARVTGPAARQARSTRVLLRRRARGERRTHTSATSWRSASPVAIASCVG